MRTLRWSVAVLALGLLATSGWMFFVGAQGFTRFLPPRTAVVDISKIFESYQKRIVRAEELKKKYDDVMQELQNLKDSRELIEVEMKDLPPTSEDFQTKGLKLIQLGARIKEIQDKEGLDFEKKRSAFLEEIREEIKNEIRVVAESEELDLVLEKAVSAENPRAGLGFHWAIVHFAKPEFDITQKVAERLNERFKRP
jgi:Skp family chaperone for outer membrane proteins